MKRYLFYILLLTLSVCLSCSKDSDVLVEEGNKVPLSYSASLGVYSEAVATRYYSASSVLDVPAAHEDTLLLRDMTLISYGEILNVGFIISPSFRFPKYNVLFASDIERPNTFQWQNNIFSNEISTFLPEFNGKKWTTKIDKNSTFPTFMYDIDPTKNDSVYLVGSSEGRSDIVFGASSRMEAEYSFQVRHCGSKLSVNVWDGKRYLGNNPYPVDRTKSATVYLMGYQHREPVLTFHKAGGDYTYVIPESFKGGFSALPDSNRVSGAESVSLSWRDYGELDNKYPLSLKSFNSYTTHNVLLAPQKDLSKLQMKIVIPASYTIDRATEQTYTLPFSDIKLEDGTPLKEIPAGCHVHVEVYVSLVEGLQAVASVANWSPATAAAEIELSGTDSTFVSR